MSKQKQQPQPQKGNTTEVRFPLAKENYRLMLLGFAIIVLGFILMSGGGNDDPNTFNPEIFSFRRITLAPIVVLFGFAFEVYAIMKRPKSSSNE